MHFWQLGALALADSGFALKRLLPNFQNIATTLYVYVKPLRWVRSSAIDADRLVNVFRMQIHHKNHFGGVFHGPPVIFSFGISL